MEWNGNARAQAQRTSVSLSLLFLIANGSERTSQEQNDKGDVDTRRKMSLKRQIPAPLFSALTRNVCLLFLI